MKTTHVKTYPRSRSRIGENKLPEVTMWGGPSATHIYIHIPNVPKERIQINYPTTQAIGTVNVPSSPNDLIRIVLPKHVT